MTGREELRELRDSVERSFDLRQEVQRLEAERLRLKLQAIEDSLEARQKAREAIIHKRVKELSKRTK